VTLRCDGNGLWNLNESLTFGLRAAEFDLQYIEEPVASVENDLAAFHCTTGVPVALDESVDRAMHLAWRRYHEHDEHDSASKESSAEPQSVAQALRELFEPTFGVVALVLKPSVLGGYENCALVASAAREKGIGSVVTSAFESGVGVAHCANFAAALDLASLNAAAKARETTRTGASSEDDQGDDSYSPGSGFRVTAHTGDSSDDDQTHGETQWNSTGTLQITPHGLGTGAWLVGDVTKRDFAPMVRRIDETGAPLGVGISLRGGSATDMASDFSWRPEVVFPVSAQGESPESWGVTSFIDVITDVGVYRFFVTDSGRNGDGNDDPTNPDKEKAVLFLHGFLGDGTDWTCVVAGLLESARCVVVDLPNHGGTVFVPGPGFQRKDGMTIEAMSNAIGKLGQELFVSKKISLGGKNGAKNKSSSFPSVTLVGYSLGARIALSYAVDGDKHGGWLKHGGGVVSIGGSPGISTSDFDRADRASRDDHLATALRESGVQAFTRAWYENGLFGGLVSHPRFQGCNSPEFVRAARSANVPDAAGKLAEVLSQASPGRQQVVTVEKLLASGVRVDFITGANDKKFVKVANAIADGMRKQSGTKTSKVTSQTVPNAGHAAHLEAPEGLVLPLLRCVLENAKRSE
jgi:isochorismate synthase/2-succinyl-5-enolpyruvyl-6-hydroxy-3-cyclohexene-1-carboxylate synthase/2-succinyl-6-hydroxy-2,4-cyclohexadiene-1-carboxylate synthase/O-succinylbenzoate synthase